MTITATTNTRTLQGERAANAGTAAARILLAFIFFVSGLNGFFHVLSIAPMHGAAETLIEGLVASGYVFPVLFATYILAGGVLLVGRLVPLALVLLAPAIVALEIFLAWCYRAAYAPLLRAHIDAGQVSS